MDKATVDYCHVDTFRIGVRTDEWDQIKTRFESIGSCNATRRKLSLGTQDSVTGWYAKQWEQITVEGVFVPQATSYQTLPTGSYSRVDGVFYTADPVRFGDEIRVLESGVVYEVKGVKDHYTVGGDSFSYRECRLGQLPMHKLSYTDKSAFVNDARTNTVDYWTTYMDSAKLHGHEFIVCYGNPDYPLLRVFLDKMVHIIFSVDLPNSTADVDGDLVARRYIEHVPTDVIALDTELMNLGRQELRRITENYPTGSQRALESMRPQTLKLGSHTLWSQRHVLTYRRGTT